MNPLFFLPDIALVASVYLAPDRQPSWSTGDPPEFNEIFRSATSAIEDDPKNVQSYFMRGVVCQSKGWYPQALLDFVDVVRIDPKHARAWLLMSEVLTNMGNTEKAEWARQQAMEIDPSL